MCDSGRCRCPGVEPAAVGDGGYTADVLERMQPPAFVPSEEFIMDMVDWLYKRANERAWGEHSLQHESTVIRETADALAARMRGK